MKSLSLLIIIFYLVACSHKSLKVKTIAPSYQGIIAQSLVIKNRKQQITIVCYSEILNQKIHGLSCQNDTGLPLFSGGMTEKGFELEKISRFIFKIEPENVLSYIRISLFSEYLIENNAKYSIKIKKNFDRTLIQDEEQKLSIDLVIL